MCFPRLNKCFCCFSLRTGIYIICWTGLLWNLVCLFIFDKEPLVLNFLDEEKILNFSPYKIEVYSQLYYVTQNIIMLFALIGIYSKQPCCLNLLVGSETIILLAYFLMTLAKVNRCIARTGTPIEEETVGMFIILGFKYYLYLIIISFSYEVMHGRDGRARNGWIVSQNNAFIAPPSAPSASELPLDTAQFVDTPYPVQPTSAPFITHSYPVIYPHHEQLIPQQVPIQKQPYPYAPPPYPLPQTHVINENPPPYAP